jgi:hypothetical protein
VSYQEKDNTNDTVYLMKKKGTASWSTIFNYARTAVQSNYDLRTQIAIDALGSRHLVFVEPGQSGNELAHVCVKGAP